MPNWVANKVVITGDKDTIATVKAQLCKPYASHHWDIMSESVSHDTVEGDFLLWNIVQPTNLPVYYEYAKRMKEAEDRKNAVTNTVKQTSPEDVVGMLQEGLNSITPEDMSNFAQKFEEDVRIGQDWYHWNIRNWGTKWEISDSTLVKAEDERLEYVFDTAWSPPVPALDELAACYPSLIITLACIDEGDCFALEMHWENRKRQYESELSITHGLKEDFYGECYACSNGNENDPELEDYRKELRCAEFNTKIEIEGVI